LSSENRAKTTVMLEDVTKPATRLMCAMLE